MCKSYLTFKPISSPSPKALFRVKNVKFVHTACFPHDRFSGYDFSANLASHVWLPNEEMVLSSIKPFLKTGGIING